ncbi:MAG: prepilin-type N-terminal cleavage/methylation domain-containing protein [Candidatus Korobacteraceae bacterium]
MLPSPAHKQAHCRGFSMIEVVCALAILSVGVMAAAALTAKMLSTGRQSRYMSLASTLASEKLEDLNHYSPNDPQVCVPSASVSVGSLTSDIMQSTTCPPSVAWSTGFTGTVAYYDNVSISLSTATTACPNPTAGCFSETVSGMTGGNASYTTTYHSPDGQVVTPAASSTAPSNVTFHRRWTIEGNQPVTGTRRVTVLVTLMDTTVQPSVTFQMSLVRP